MPLLVSLPWLLVDSIERAIMRFCKSLFHASHSNSLSINFWKLQLCWCSCRKKSLFSSTKPFFTNCIENNGDQSCPRIVTRSISRLSTILHASLIHSTAIWWWSCLIDLLVDPCSWSELKFHDSYVIEGMNRFASQNLTDSWCQWWRQHKHEAWQMNFFQDILLLPRKIRASSRRKSENYFF